ncbi:MAG TPA: hypothetical protein VEN95_03570 [Actinomycetota bacterium]|jgi:hypothetical protein|nr:hypothetical protein [Actinomycetota bacterium]
MTERPEEVPSEDVVRGPEDNEGVPEDDDSGDEVRPEVESEGEVAKAEATPSGDEGGAGPLLAEEDAGGFRSRWNEIQVRFVDEPRGSVQKADGLVVEMTERLARMFSEERTRLDSQWERGDDVSTEDLRIALQRYRSFFERLLSA